MGDIYVDIVASTGEVFPLEDDRTSARGLMMTGYSGLRSKIDRSTRLKALGVGVEVGALTIPEMEGRIALYCCPTDEKTSAEIYREFNAALGVMTPATLRVTDTQGLVWSTQFVLTEPLPELEHSTTAVGRKRFPFELPLFCPQGAYIGELIDHGTAGQLSNHGDLPAQLWVVWEASATVAHNGNTLILPATSGGLRYMSLDYATGFRVTRNHPDGDVDVSTWATFRGKGLHVRVPPGGTQEVITTGGARILSRTMCTNPWR